MLSNSPFTNRPARHLSYTESLWNIDWRDFFPLNLTDSEKPVQFVPCDFGEIQIFLKNNRQLLQDPSEENCQFLLADECKHKLKYYQEFADTFAFISQDKIVGTFIGHPLDWSTYYFRYVNVLPQFRGQDLCHLACEQIISILRQSGVDRIESDVSPANLHQVNRLNRMQFNVTGMILSERWGSLLKHTKYLNPKHERTFINQFCVGLRPQLQLLNKENEK